MTWRFRLLQLRVRWIKWTFPWVIRLAFLRGVVKGLAKVVGQALSLGPTVGDDDDRRKNG
jgi:hypothetical protein